MASTSSLSGSKLFDLTGKVALVTGGGSGIGLMATQALAANGAKVYICGRTKEKLETVASKHNDSSIPGEIIPLQGDINSKEGIKALVEEYKKHEKCLCILVNNAGISSASLTTGESNSAQELSQNLFGEEKSNFDDWTNTYQTNVAGPFFTTSAFLPLLRASTEKHSGWSSTVINITSISGIIQKSQHHFSYNASKGAAEHLTRMLASEIADLDLGIRVNSIAPGVFPSEMTAGESDGQQKSSIEKDKYEKVPAHRPGKDEDMAQAVLFAASNQYFNGQAIVVDGGYTLMTGR